MSLYDQETEVFSSEDVEVTARLDITELRKDMEAKNGSFALVSRDGQTVFQLTDGINTLGRLKRANSVVIKDKFCSALHAELQIGEDGITITDMGSTNGTFVNGTKITPIMPHSLQLGDEITVGRSHFRFEVILDE